MDRIQSNNSKTEQVRKMRDRTEPVDRQQEYWTDDELQRLESMFYEGVGITGMAGMAPELGRSETAIWNRIHGFYRRVRAPRQSKAECQCRKCAYYIDGECTCLNGICGTAS